MSSPMQIDDNAPPSSEASPNGNSTGQANQKSAASHHKTSLGLLKELSTLSLSDPAYNTLKAAPVQKGPAGRRKSGRAPVPVKKGEPSELSMPAPAGTKRVKGKRVTRQFIIGSEAWTLDSSNRPPGIPDDHTKGWRVYVRNVPEGPDITTWLKKVQFKLFHTYQNNLRTIESPPFEVPETGWGGFAIDIRLHFSPLSGEKPQWRQHFLQLEPYGGADTQAAQRAQNKVVAEMCEFVEFNEPTEAFFDALTDEAQWDYLAEPARAACQWLPGPGPGGLPPAPTPTTPAPAAAGGKGKGKKAAQRQGPALDANGNPRTVELPQRSTAANPYSREMEEAVLRGLTEADKTLGEQMRELDERKAAIEKRLAELRGTGDVVMKKK